MGGISYSKSHPFFSFSHDLAISRDQRVEKQYRQEPLKVGHHAAKFCVTDTLVVKIQWF